MSTGCPERRGVGREKDIQCGISLLRVGVRLMAGGTIEGHRWGPHCVCMVCAQLQLDLCKYGAEVVSQQDMK